MHRLFLIVVIAFCLLGFCFPSGGAQAPQALYSSQLRVFEKFVRRQMAADRIPGLSIGFVKGDFTWASGYGFADLENKTPASTASAYRLASITKSMTAAGLLRLMEQGKIDLDAELQTYVPKFPKKKYPVTIRQLLGHLGGIRHNNLVEGRNREQMTTEKAVAQYADTDLILEPGVRYSYSTPGFNLLGAAIEGSSGKTYGEYMREQVWRPLGMNDTRMDSARDLIPNRVRGYTMIKGEIKLSEAVDVSNKFAGGGTRATVPDLLRFARGVMSHKLLSPKTTGLMWTPQANRAGHYSGVNGGEDYAMGWFVGSTRGHFVAYHTGGQQETSTLLILYPAVKFAIAVASNLEGADTFVYARRLGELILDEPWGTIASTRNKADEPISRAMASVFDYGLMHFERAGRPISDNLEEVGKAFAYFDRCVSREALQSSPKELEALIRDGRHPAANSAFVRMGSWMTAKLHEKYGPKRLDAYYKAGPIPFFADYVTLSQSAPAFPKELRLNEAFENLVLRWDQDWKRTWTAQARQITFAPEENFAAIDALLRKSFAGAEIYPDFSLKLMEATRQLSLAGDKQNALLASKLAVDLYPGFAGGHAVLGLAKTVFGEKEGAVDHLKRSLELNPNGLASINNLNQIAFFFAGTGKVEEALAVLKAGEQLHPQAFIFATSMKEIAQRRDR